MAVELTDAQMKEAMSKVQVLGAFGSLCRRTLKTCAETDPSIDRYNAQNLQIIGALKSINPKAVVTAGILPHWISKTKVFETNKKMVWCRAKITSLSSTKVPLIERLVPPEQIPGSVDTSKYWVFDYHTPSGPHLKGSWIQEVGVTSASQSSLGPKNSTIAFRPAVCASLQVETEECETKWKQLSERIEQGRGASEEANPTDTIALGALPQKRRRMLGAQPSNEIVSEEDATEALAQLCREDCKAGRFYSEDQLDSDCAAFKVRMLLGHLRATKAAHTSSSNDQNFCDMLETHQRMFVRHLIKWLLEGKTFKVMHHFVKCFSEAMEIDASLTPDAAVIKLVSDICKFDLATPFGKGDLDISKYCLNPSNALFFNTSTFYMDFIECRIFACFEKAKKWDTDSERLPLWLDLVDGLLRKLVGALCIREDMRSMKTELEIVKTTATATLVSKMKYTLALSLENFAIFAEWFPKDDCLCLRALLAGVKFNGMSFKSFMEAFLKVGAEREVHDAVTNSVVRSLFPLLAKLKEVRLPMVDKPVVDKNDSKFVARLMCDIAQLRLGFEDPPSPCEYVAGTISKDLIPALAPILKSAMHEKFLRTVERFSMPALDDIVTFSSPCPGDVSQKAKREDASNDARPDQALRASSSVDAVKPSEQAPSFMVGQVVMMTLSPKDAATYLNMKAEVCTIKADNVNMVVKMLEGAKAGSNITRPMSYFSAVKTDQMCASQEERKKQQEDADAIRVFGESTMF